MKSNKEYRFKDNQKEQEFHDKFKEMFETSNYLTRLFNVIIFLVIFLGIPFLAGSWGWLLISWLPAVIIINYLDDGEI